MSYTNVGGVWKDGTDYVNINGVWKKKGPLYTNVNGVWRSDNPYPKFDPILVTPAGSSGNITGYGAGWVTDGYQLSLITGYDADQGVNRMYACGAGGSYYVYPIKTGDVLEWTASYINYGNSGRNSQIYIGFYDSAPGSGRSPVPVFSGYKSVPYSSTWVSTSNKTTYTASYSSKFMLGLMVDLGYDYQHIVCTIHSVKLNGYEILK